MFKNIIFPFVRAKLIRSRIGDTSAQLISVFKSIKLAKVCSKSKIIFPDTILISYIVYFPTIKTLFKYVIGCKICCI
jgi:hypothetical protein